MTIIPNMGGKRNRIIRHHKLSESRCGVALKSAQSNINGECVLTTVSKAQKPCIVTGIIDEQRYQLCKFGWETS
jgi:hypothetical protein